MESLSPAEVKITDSGTLLPEGNESVVKQIKVLSRETGTSTQVKKDLIYKRLHEGAFTREILGNTIDRKPLTAEQATELANEKQNEYLDVLICYGREHVAETHFTVGADEVDPKRPQVHIFQEPVDEILDLPWLRPGDRSAKQSSVTIRNKNLSELMENCPTDPREGYMREWLFKHQRALQDFYPSYVEGVLLGFFPDIKIIADSSKEDDDPVDAGLLFTSNVGIKPHEDGSEALQLFDFGKPSMNFLTLESRQRLRKLIDDKKTQGELAVQHITRLKEFTFRGEKLAPLRDDFMDLADWYEEALRNELILSLATKEPVLRETGTLNNWYSKLLDKNDDESKNKLVRFMIYDIKTVLFDNYADEKYGAGRLHSELVSYRKLCEADGYQTEVTVRTITEQALEQKITRTFKKIGNQIEFEVTQEK